MDSKRAGPSSSRTPGAQVIDDPAIHRAEHAHGVLALDAGPGMHQAMRQGAIVGPQEQAAGIEVQAPDVYPAPRELAGQRVEDGGPARLVPARTHHPGRLVIPPHPRPLRAEERFRRQALAIHLHAIAGHDAVAEPRHALVDEDPAGRDPALDGAARAEPGARQDLLYSFSTHGF